MAHCAAADSRLAEADEYETGGATADVLRNSRPMLMSVNVCVIGEGRPFCHRCCHMNLM